MGESLELTVLEAAVLDKLLTDEHPVLIGLREQLATAHVKSREVSGVGFFTEFEWPRGVDPVLAAPASIRFGDLHAEFEGLQHGAGFILFVDEGVATMLEGYTYIGAWPKDEVLVSLEYVSSPRNFAELEWEGSLGMLKLFRDASTRPELFVWNGAIDAQAFELWMLPLCHAPFELIELWKQTGGGELFESETILGPGAGELDSSLKERNDVLREEGLPDTYVVFHEGFFLSAFRPGGLIVELNDRFQEIRRFVSFAAWYGAIRAEFADRYGLNQG
ncbi:MAG: hypothetical protein AB8H86_15765 [Polyangiales bacterium]